VEIPTPPSKLTQSTKIIKKTPPPAEEADKVDEEELQVKSPLQEAKKVSSVYELFACGGYAERMQAGTKATPRLKSDTSSSKTSQGSDEPYIEKRWPPKVNRESDGSEASSLETAKPDKTAAIPKPELVSALATIWR